MVLIGWKYWVKKNAFWKESLELSYQNLNEINVVSDQDVLSIPLWYNQDVSRNYMFKPYMYKKDLIVIGNLLQEGKFLSKEDLELSYGVSHINFLDYYQLKLDVLTFIKSILWQKPILWLDCSYHFHLKPILMAKKGCRHIYNKIYCQTFKSKYKDKCNSDLELQIDKFTWRRIFYICFKSVYNNDLVWIQYKSLHRIPGTQRMMFNMKITGSDLCWLCKRSI